MARNCLLMQSLLCKTAWETIKRSRSLCSCISVQFTLSHLKFNQSFILPIINDIFHTDSTCQDADWTLPKSLPSFIKLSTCFQRQYSDKKLHTCVFQTLFVTTNLSAWFRHEGYEFYPALIWKQYFLKWFWINITPPPSSSHLKSFLVHTILQFILKSLCSSYELNHW